MSKRRSSLVPLMLTGFVMAMAGVVWGILTVKQHGDAAVDRNASLLIGPLVLVGIGSVLLTIARVWNFFRDARED